MSSKTSILNRIRNNKPSVDTSVDLSQFFIEGSSNMLGDFCSGLAANGGRYLIAKEESSLGDILAKEVSDKSYVDLSGVLVSDLQHDNSDVDVKSYKDTRTVIFTTQVGVAENGAVWVDDQMLQGLRILPFIVEHTIVILKISSIVPTIHHAYRKIGKTETGFGTFLAGPSKTGDIEQNLVIGAHGALSHLVVLI